MLNWYLVYFRYFPSKICLLSALIYDKKKDIHKVIYTIKISFKLFVCLIVILLQLSY